MKRREKLLFSSIIGILLFLVFVTWLTSKGAFAQEQKFTVIPSPITLETAGKPVKAKISGTNLRYLKSLKVVRRGLVCREVTVKRIKSEIVEFRASANATPARDYQLRAILSLGGRIQTMDIPTTVFSISVIHVERPDLVIGNVTFRTAEESGDPGSYPDGQMIVYIRNLGRGIAQFRPNMMYFRYKIYYFVRNNIGLPSLQIDPVPITRYYPCRVARTISAGGAAGYVLDNPRNTFVARIEFEVDPYRKIIESDEYNNYYKVDFPNPYY